METGPFATVLGQPGILKDVEERLAGSHRQVLAYDGDTVIGMAGFEPLYGHHGEAAIAVKPGATGALAAYLLDGLIELATAAGLTALRFVFDSGHQRAYAMNVINGRSSCSLRPDRLEVRTGLGVGPTAGRTHVHAR